MDKTINLNLLLEQMKEKEERDAAYAKRIKDAEAAVKTAEEEIKRLEPQKLKLKEDINKKQLELSRKTIDYDLLLNQKEIWTELHKKTCSSLKEKKGELEAVQQSVFTNRISFCDGIDDFVDKHGLLQMSRGIFKPSPSSLFKQVIVKTEQEEDEYNSLLETMNSLDRELEEMNTAEAEVEEAIQLKAQLQAEPSCGENFIRLRNTLKDMKDNLHKGEEEVKKVKSAIAQTELNFLSKKNPNKVKECKMMNNQVSHEDFEQTNTVQTDTCERKSSDLKVVKFSSLVETRKIESSPQLKSILKTTNFKARSPSSCLRKRISQGQIYKLDQEMNSILFDRKNTTATSSSNP